MHAPQVFFAELLEVQGKAPALTELIRTRGTSLPDGSRLGGQQSPSEPGLVFAGIGATKLWHKRYLKTLVAGRAK